ncbi:hypothetical protein F4810DRAFT_693561 [Camillea tinctor]|nr:hypothetical protein F4810DRAFT_693561 [Camillea tinctor]
MDNNGIAYSQSAELVTQQPNGSSSKHPPSGKLACQKHVTNNRKYIDHDELSPSEPIALSPSSNRPPDETLSSSAPAIPAKPEDNKGKQSTEKSADTNMPAKPKRTVRFTDDDDPAPVKSDISPPKTRTSKSMTTSPPVRAPPTPMATGRKRGRPPMDQNTTPRKRGRPRKNPIAMLNREDSSPSPPPSASRGKNTQPSTESKGIEQTPEADGEPTMENLVREAFVVHELSQDDGTVSIPHDLAVQIHALLAPGLPVPRGDVRVQAELAGRIRVLFEEE